MKNDDIILVIIGVVTLMLGISLLSVTVNIPVDLDAESMILFGSGIWLIIIAFGFIITAFTTIDQSFDDNDNEYHKRIVRRRPR